MKELFDQLLLANEEYDKNPTQENKEAAEKAKAAYMNRKGGE